MSTNRRYREASTKTANRLKAIAQSPAARTLSQLTLPEIEAVVQQIAQMVPAGNVPTLILSGLLRLPGRKLSAKIVRQDINLLFRGLEQVLDTAVYGTFFAGPAAIIWAYQGLLKLAGKNPEDAFPNGPWQFYVNYAMREDTARHACETHGFDTYLQHYGVQLRTVDRMTAWVMAAIHCLYHYDGLLANEWRERVYLHLLAQVAQNESNNRYSLLDREWRQQRPYGLESTVLSAEPYPAFRRRQFDRFLTPALNNLPDNLRDQWRQRVDQAEAEDLPAYQRQMSILATLEPELYDERHTPLPLEKAQVGIIYNGCYYFVPVCVSASLRPTEIETVRAMVAAIAAGFLNQATHLTPLAQLKRNHWPNLRHQLNKTDITELKRLHQAPILLNFDNRPRHLPLSELRQTERGIGSHALTVFDTGETFVFDQSHIFFDAVWGTALAEIMTQEATTWAKGFFNVDESQLLDPLRPKILSPNFQPSDLTLIRRAPQVALEVGAETEAVDLGSITELRERFKQRNERIQLTVNDLLILYRAIHAATYQPKPDLIAQLQDLAKGETTRLAAQATLEALDQANQLNPTIVMPVDASRRSPRDRLYPITFEVPIHDLDILGLHKRSMTALTGFKTQNNPDVYAEFDRLRRLYLATLAGFGAWLNRAKTIAGAGESFSISTIKLLAHMPTPLQRLLDRIPNNFDLLSDLIKGRENISNVGAVASTSTLTRFMSAKDDSDQKTLIWGVLTDAKGVMRITLRDFRPHVELLIACGHKNLAADSAQHYLDTYANGLNQYIDDLLHITQTSLESYGQKAEQSRDR